MAGRHETPRDTAGRNGMQRDVEGHYGTQREHMKLLLCVSCVSCVKCAEVATMRRSGSFHKGVVLPLASVMMTVLNTTMGTGGVLLAPRRLRDTDATGPAGPDGPGARGHGEAGEARVV